MAAHSDNKAVLRQQADALQLPVYLQPWWWDAVVGPEAWQVALSIDAAGHINGVLPWWLYTRMGLSRVAMPPFTDYAGPYVRLPNDPTMKAERRSTLTQRILQRLVAQLPEVAYFTQQYDPALTNWLPWYWTGYEQTTHYTYRISAELTPQLAWQQLKRTVRTDVRNAQARVELSTAEDLALLQACVGDSFARQRRVAPYNWTAFERLAAILQQQEQGRLQVALDKRSRAVHAALYQVWDEHTTYFLLAGRSEDFPESRAMHALYWQGIEQALVAGRSVDFCGSMLQGVEHLLRSFGAERVPYFRIRKFASRPLRWVTSWLGRLN